ncbi:MAG TPA: AtpZ/AtpI family protein [Rhodospirillales bacterium]|nr:AtpZ/AtpI family protein [Rhodospirillales bacterium]
MSESKPPKSPKETESLEDLDKRLCAALAKSEPAKPAGDSGGIASGAGVAAKIGVEMVSALVIGVVIGVSLDKWLETAPLFLIVFLFLGAAAGFLNVYRTASGYGSAIGYKRPAEEDAAEENEEDKEDEERKG